MLLKHMITYNKKTFLNLKYFLKTSNMCTLALILCLLLINSISAELYDPTDPPGVSVFRHGENHFPWIRTPSIITTSDGTLVAFAFCRHYTGNGCQCNTTSFESFKSFEITDSADGVLCSKISTNNGESWSNMTYPFGQSFTSRVGASVYDSFNNVIIFQSVVYGQTSNQTVYQIKSTNSGQTWSKPIDIGRLYLGQSIYKNLKNIGEGNGLQLKNGRIIFVGHTNDDNAITWYSTDYGNTYNISQNIIQNLTECTMVELSNKSVMINCRSPDLWKECSCRGIAMSNDHGKSWSKPYGDKNLIGPSCEGSLISSYDDSLIFFSNPNNKKNRVDITVKKSKDNGNTWNDGYVVYDGPGAYTCLTRMKDNSQIGILYETTSKNCVGDSCDIKFVTVST
eukprot:63063_1